MKFTKPGPNIFKKSKASLADRSKFKSKDAAAPSGKLQKSAKHAVNLIKKGSFDTEVGILIKNDNNELSFKKPKKKPTSKPAKLSPGVKFDLKLDELIEKKVREKKPDLESSKLSANGKNVNSLNNFTTSPSDSSPKPKKKRNRGKKKLNIVENGNQNKINIAPNTNQKKSNFDVTQNVSPSKKQAKKRKVKNVVQSTESEESPAKKVVSFSTEEPAQIEKNESRKKKGKVNQSEGGVNTQSEKSDAANSQATIDGTDFTLNSKEVLKAVKSSIELYKNKMKSTNKLLDSEPEPIFLNFLFFIPHTKQRIIRFDLAHTLVTRPSDICLFVTDTAKKNADESKSQWVEKLRDENITNISEVIPLRSLLTDYKQFQDKRKLSERFDFFMVDGRISHRVFGLVGKFFHSRRKTPAPAVLKEGKMAEGIQKALLKTVARYTPAAEAFSIQIGHTQMNVKEVEKNVMKVWEQYPQQFGVYWENIRRASLVITGLPVLPIFCSVNPPVGAPRIYKNMKWTKDSNVPIIGELSTAMDKKVLVYPSGEVVVKNASKVQISEDNLTKKQKKNRLKRLKKKLKKSGEVKDDENLESDDDLGGRADMLESESEEEKNYQDTSSEDEEPRKRKSADVLSMKKTANQNKGNRLKTKNEYSDDDDDSDNSVALDKAEMMYLQDLSINNKEQLKRIPKENVGKDLQSGSDSDLLDDSEDSQADDVDSEASQDDIDSEDSQADDFDSEDSEIDDVASDDSLDDLSFEDSQDEEEVMKKPVGKSPKTKQQNKNGNIKGGVKMIGAAQTATKFQTKKAQKKSGAIKNSPPQRPNNKKKSNKPTTSGNQDGLTLMKLFTPSFVGVKANQKKKSKKQGQGVKNKQMAKKLAE